MEGGRKGIKEKERNEKRDRQEESSVKELPFTSKSARETEPVRTKNPNIS